MRQNNIVHMFYGSHLYGTMTPTAKVEVFENGRTYSKQSKSIVKPQQ